MAADFLAARAFVAVATAGGFRSAAKAAGMSASSLSGAVQRLESRLGVRLLNRTTRTVSVTEAGGQLLDQLRSAMDGVEAALDQANDYRASPKGVLRLNVPVNAARLILPRLLPGFLKEFPEVSVQVVCDHNAVDILAAGCDAGIRYDERLTKSMIAVPIGPRRQRFATAAAPSYLACYGRPAHPKDLLDHKCLAGSSNGGTPPPWEFERRGTAVRIEPTDTLTVDANAVDLAVSAAIDGCGVVHLFEEWLQPALDVGALEPVLEPWWQAFDGPHLYYYGQARVPGSLRAFIGYVQNHRW